jgi:hypothetical protein
VRIGTWNIGGFPSDLFDGMQGTLSSLATISTDGQTISYTWERSFLLETATLVLTMLPGPGPLDQHWNWTFSDNVFAGALVITADTYVLDTENDLWQITYALPAGHYSFTGVGSFGGCLFDGPSPLMEFYAAVWEDLPPDEREP